jgi:hypothetical protein
VAQQAWLPPRGEASLSLGFSHAFASEHVGYQGNPVAPGDMLWNYVVADLGYGVTDRFAVRLTLPPLVVSKYGERSPTRLSPATRTSTTAPGTARSRTSAPKSASARHTARSS